MKLTHDQETREDYHAAMEKYVTWCQQQTLWQCQGCECHFNDLDDVHYVTVSLYPKRQFVTPPVSDQETIKNSAKVQGVLLCTECVRERKSHVYWGVTFCERAGCERGIEMKTGRTKPINKGDEGVWIEYRCDRCGETNWEPLD